MVTLQIVDPAKEVRKSVDDYFGKVKHEVTASSCGESVFVDVSYEDFKPIDVVRDEIKKLYPKVVVCEIRRGISYEHRLGVLAQMLQNDEQIYICTDGETIRPILVGELTEERLVNVEL